ncbi:MAG: acyl-protein synthetase [Helicobacteraceae bacterium]|jgi:phenylacetate-coenzyme A ligase PaaK-like adenylate-forming protein|nr:acyl-protein synthetase [Helicobacteraceae bacterium]
MYDELFSLPVYGLRRAEKEDVYSRFLRSLSAHHYNSCEAYRRVADIIGIDAPLPARIFKDFDLLSVDRKEIVKTIVSSGTSGRQSKVFLDHPTAARQTKALFKIVSDFIGTKRLPMLVIDSPSLLEDRAAFSARAAGIMGFSIFGRDITYALDRNMNLNINVVENFLNAHRGEKILLFGFTYIIWLHLCEALRREDKKLTIDGILIHGGGWKKLADLNIGNDRFKNEIKALIGVERVHSYYGMAEQTGSIFMECEYSHLHCSIFSDIVIHDPLNFAALEKGRGVIECDSLLPTSSPSHRLLTEDEGELLGADDCPCKRRGKYFAVYGRIKGAEMRGCGNTYERR